eukprot:2347855-Pyramimonas_sp.AAC.1
MRPRRAFRHTPYTFRGPLGSATKGSCGSVSMRPRHTSAHPLHVSWSHGKLHPKALATAFSCVPAAPFGIPLTCFVV